jgi:hypothetical protein
MKTWRHNCIYQSFYKWIACVKTLCLAFFKISVLWEILLCLLWNSWTHFRLVNDLNQMSQMNVFQKLGHAYIPIDYIRIKGCAAWWNNSDKMEWHVRHESTWWNTHTTLQTILVILYRTVFILYICCTCFSLYLQIYAFLLFSNNNTNNIGR